MKGVIYCYHCIPTGKKYIGQTDNERRRNYEHRYQAKTKKKFGYNCKFYNAVRKYGWDSFVYGIIEEFDISLLEEKEIFFIEKYDTYRNGYNTTFGGKTIRGYKHSVETKENMRRKALGRKHTDETKKLISKSLKIRATSMKYLYELQSPNKEVFITNSLEGFCKENPQYNLYRRLLCDVAHGKQRHHKGWTVRILEHLT
jgi:group I intron endonuclease